MRVAKSSVQRKKTRQEKESGCISVSMGEGPEKLNIIEGSAEGKEGKNEVL